MLSEAGKACSNGRTAVDDIETCKHVAESLNFNFKKSENTADWPRGCYVVIKDVYFNYHSTGGLRNVSHICKPKGKGRLYHLEECYQLVVIP